MTFSDQFRFGADPEVFLRDRRGNLVTAREAGVPGTKARPYDLGDGFAVQMDGLAMEFNTPVVDRLSDLQEVARQGLHRCLDLLGDKSLSVNPIITANFKKTAWDSIPDGDKILGCEPSFGMRGGIIRTRCPARSRYVGGHIHISWGEGLDTQPGSNHDKDCQFLLQYLTGLPTSCRGESRYYSGYGKNNYRPKHYGMEWRSPSSKWVFHGPTWNYVASYLTEGVGRALGKCLRASTEWRIDKSN